MNGSMTTLVADATPAATTGSQTTSTGAN